MRPFNKFKAGKTTILFDIAVMCTLVILWQIGITLKAAIGHFKTFASSQMTLKAVSALERMFAFAASNKNSLADVITIF